MRRVRWCDEKVEVPGVALCDYEKETAFQIYCADWLRKRFEVTQDRKFSFWHHSANERSNVREGFTVKMMGQSRGFPDFIQCELRVAIEFKVGNGLLSAEQEKWMNYFKEIGWTTGVVHRFKDFKKIVDSF